MSASAHILSYLLYLLEPVWVISLDAHKLAVHFENVVNVWLKRNEVVAYSSKFSRNVFQPTHTNLPSHESGMLPVHGTNAPEFDHCTKQEWNLRLVNALYVRRREIGIQFTANKMKMKWWNKSRKLVKGTRSDFGLLLNSSIEMGDFYIGTKFITPVKMLQPRDIAFKSYKHCDVNCVVNLMKM